MSVNDLISLANEFAEEVSPTTMRAPNSNEISTKSPVSITHKKEDVQESSMDFGQVIHMIRNYAKFNLLKDGDSLEDIKHTAINGGSHFGIVASTPTQAEHIYKKMLTVFMQVYPTTTHKIGNSSATLDYPAEMARVTFSHFNQDITFSIRDSD